ncbi:protein eva-1 homolog C-like [Pollicipes pollicipes]|uniref:protein eva-1 homolog C-like n=1 Tax=Pollicipes pollicipes TaxID=41117 RepID=UPI00188566DE|nr:protein eva-1 homolog C-like [Pollicipes pollicipes]
MSVGRPEQRCRRSAMWWFVGHVFMWLWLVGVGSQRVFREDRLALLSGTLRTFQVASCDGDQLRLECPAGTTVSIQLVQYGRLAAKPDLCGQASDMRRFNYTDCMDRSALKVVIAACAGRRQCQLQTSAQLFGVDPCPGISKFVEVLFKCRPTQFRSQVVCQGQRRTIYCGQDRVAIYSASFGTRKEGSVHCPQPPGVQLTDCQASFTSEKMISLCQGKPSCDLVADPELYSRACPRDHKMYLTTTYTCVPKEILREQYGQEVDEDYQQNMTEAPSPIDRQASAGMDAPNLSPSGDNGREQLILYLTLGVACSLMLCLAVVVGRMCCHRRRRRRDKHARSEPPPPAGLTTTLGQLDADLDLGSASVSSGRLTPPYAEQVSFGAPPSERSRYGSPYRDSLGSCQLAGREPSYGGSVRSFERASGPRAVGRTPPSVFYCS